VTFDECSGDVVLELSSFTKGAGALGFIAMPFIRPIQFAFFKDVIGNFPLLIKKYRTI
jgi:hypothetical protein